METNKTTQQRRRYVPQHVVALTLDVGASIYISHLALPESKVLVPGIHYDWEVPMKNRQLLGGRRNFNESHAAKLTANEPLVVALHNPWVDAGGNPTFQGAGAVGHIRLARETHHQLGIVGTMAEHNFSNDFSIWRPCKEMNKPEEMVLGGPKYAVIYADELVLPAFRWDENDETTQDKMFCWIVNQSEVPMLQMQFRRNASMMHAVREGGEVKMTAPPNGAVSKKNIGGILITFDQSGRIFALEQKGQPKASVPFKNGVVLTVREMIAHNGLREALGLPVIGGDSEFAPQRDKPSLVSVGQALQGLDIPVAEGTVRTVSAPDPEAAPARAVPLAVRRAEAPKLEDVAKQPVIAQVVEDIPVQQPPVEQPAAELVEEPEDRPLARSLTEAEWPQWGNEAIVELMKKTNGQSASGEYRTEDGEVLAEAGAPMTVDVLAAIIQAHDRLAFEGEDAEQFYSIKEILGVYVEVYAAA